MPALSQKEAGAYYTPDAVVGTLLRWAVRHEDDRLLDPACGDGRFIAGHRNAVGIEQDTQATQSAMERAPWALVHEGDFFSWAAETPGCARNLSNPSNELHAAADFEHHQLSQSKRLGGEAVVSYGRRVLDLAHLYSHDLRHLLFLVESTDRPRTLGRIRLRSFWPRGGRREHQQSAPFIWKAIRSTCGYG